MELGIQGFLGSLITNLNTKFRNSEWLIQYGDQNAKICLIRIEFFILMIFGVGDYESGHKIQKLKIADLISRKYYTSWSLKHMKF